MKKWLLESDLVDFSDKEVKKLANKLAKDLTSDEEVAKACFVYVRDQIKHSGDYKDNVTTYKASDVLKEKTGWCYAKSILLTALLRANGIPAGFCYQRLSCSEYKNGIYCLHGLNAVYLKDYGWYRIDARGNKEGVDAQFIPPQEKLAFELEDDEMDLPEIYAEPLNVVVEALKNNNSYDKMVGNFPDLPFIKKEISSNNAQEKYGTQHMASNILESVNTSRIYAHLKKIINGCSYFFLATASKDAKVNVNFKGGEKGFVHVIDENTILFPDYDGNGIFHGLNDIMENPNVGMLFIDFNTSQRFKINGVATIIDDSKTVTKYLDWKGFSEYPTRIIKVNVTYVLGNCSKYIENVRNEIVEYENSWESPCGI